MVLKWSDKCKKPHFFWSDNSIYSLTYILSGLHSTCTPGPQDLGYILSIHSTRINFNHEKKFLSRQKVGRKTASYAGVSAHLPGQGHRRMSSPPPPVSGLSYPPNSRRSQPLQQEPHAHRWTGTGLLWLREGAKQVSKTGRRYRMHSSLTLSKECRKSPNC